MANQANATVCQQCGGNNIEPRGVVVAVQPYERPKRPGSPRFERIVEHKYRCRDCAGEFSVMEEVYES